jgi:hypothetical protein
VGGLNFSLKSNFFHFFELPDFRTSFSMFLLLGGGEAAAGSGDCNTSNFFHYWYAAVHVKCR